MTYLSLFDDYVRGTPHEFVPTVHLVSQAHREEMQARGLIVGRTAHSDFTDSVVCGNGSWHMHLTTDPKKTNCPECIKRLAERTRTDGSP